MASDPTVRLKEDLYCIHCDYNLRTLALAGLCPECGSPVVDSLGSDRRWLLRVRRGLALLLVNCALLMVARVAYGLGILAHAMWIQVFLDLCACVGILLVTWPSRYSMIEAKAKVYARCARVSAWIALGLSVALAVLYPPNRALVIGGLNYFALLSCWGLAAFVSVGAHICLALYAVDSFRAGKVSLTVIARIWMATLVAMLVAYKIGLYREAMGQLRSTSRQAGTVALGICPQWSDGPLAGGQVSLLWIVLCAGSGMWFFHRCRVATQHRICPRGSSGGRMGGHCPEV